MPAPTASRRAESSGEEPVPTTASGVLVDSGAETRWNEDGAPVKPTARRASRRPGQFVQLEVVQRGEGQEDRVGVGFSDRVGAVLEVGERHGSHPR